MASGKNKLVQSLTRRQHESEESRKAERNRAVFEAWLEKKQEERKVCESNAQDVA